MSAPLATRVMKARWSRAVGCGHYVLVGHLIVKRSGKWLCIECAVAAIRARNSTEGNRA